MTAHPDHGAEDVRLMVTPDGPKLSRMSLSLRTIDVRQDRVNRYRVAHEIIHGRSRDRRRGDGPRPSRALSAFRQFPRVRRGCVRGGDSPAGATMPAMTAPWQYRLAVDLGTSTTV